jgi:hypothetical protein
MPRDKRSERMRFSQVSKVSTILSKNENPENADFSKILKNSHNWWLLKTKNRNTLEAQGRLPVACASKKARAVVRPAARANLKSRVRTSGSE